MGLCDNCGWCAVCNRQPLFFNSLGDHRSPLQLKTGSFHTDFTAVPQQKPSQAEADSPPANRVPEF